MEQYIPKSALVAEIERLLKCGKLYKSEDVETRNGILGFILSFIDTLEVKEVDLEKEEYQVSQSFEGEGLFDGNKVVLKAQK